MASGFNWFLIVVTIVVLLLVVASVAYAIVHHQHPEDRNQAWLPKAVVLVGLSLAIISVLMFPLDVANRGACDKGVVLSSCNLTLPMRDLWFAVYIMDVVLVFFIIPFTLFYYEAGSDLEIGQRIRSALLWVGMTGMVLGLILGIAYGLAGYVEFPTERVESGAVPLQTFVAAINNGSLTACISVSGDQTFDGDKCDATQGQVDKEKWKLRSSFSLYVVAVASVIGWATFMVFGGIGLASLPADMLRSFFGRPMSIITKSEYIRQARGLAQRAREIKSLGEELRKEERANGRTRRWRKHFKAVNRELVLLEDDELELEKKFPQGEDADTKWVLYQMSFYLRLMVGAVSVVVSLAWIIHIVVYMLIKPPPAPFLNDLFVELDEAFPLFGVAAFSSFCLYMIAVTVKGHVKLGLDFGAFDLYPIRAGATMMNSMLVNTALILLSSTAVIQFCSEAFAVYAEETAIQEIFGSEIENLQGIKYLYKRDVFLYCFMGFAGIGALLLLIKGPTEWKRRRRDDAYSL